MSRKELSELNRQVEEWNAQVPVGTCVNRYRLINPREDFDAIYKTRSEAQVLGDHTAVVWLEGFSGCVALESLEVTGTAVTPRGTSD